MAQRAGVIGWPLVCDVRRRRQRLLISIEEMVMNPKRDVWLLALLLAMALAAAASCTSGDSSGPTSPGGGGGGGGGTGARELDSGNLGLGGTYQHRFTAAGTYGYHCIHHSPMTGSVVVSDAAPDTLVNVSIVSSTTSFPPASVKPGGRVIWTNNDNMVHTVTSN
jgi:plastocyanin